MKNFQEELIRSSALIIAELNIHNNRNRLSADLIRKINTILKRNRRILTELNPVTC